MMVRIAIIGSLLVMLTGAAVVAVIFLNRPDGTPKPPEPREIAAVEPARPTPALPLPDPAREMPLPPEPVVRERFDPLPPEPVVRERFDPLPPDSGFSPPPPLAEPAPPVPRRKPPAPMAVEPAEPVRQPEPPMARTDPPVSDPADRDRSSPTGAYQPWTPAAEATGPAKIQPPPEPSRIEQAGRTPEVGQYKPWTSTPEPDMAEKSVPIATPEPPALAVPRTPEPASPIETAALPPPDPTPPDPGISVAPRQPPRAADTGRVPQTSRYEPWTPSGRDAPENTGRPRPPGMDLLASINPTLERIPCAVLTASVEGGTVNIWGAVRNRPDLQKVKSTLMNLRAVTGVRTTVRQMSRAQCELVDLFAPYVAANRKLDRRISVRARTPEAQYEEYDNLVLDLGSPGRDGYVYVDYYAIDGSVVHLIPSSALPANRMPAGSARRLGDRPANGEWVIGKPLGVEMIVALSSSTPLFTARREEVESAEIYLRDLRAGLERAPDGPAGQVVADIVFIKTVPIR